MSILLHAIVAAGYLGLGVRAWRGALGGTQDAVRGDGAIGIAERSAILLLWTAHAWLIRDAAFSNGALRFGFALALSATMWLTVAVFWLESFTFGLAGLRLAILPLAAVCVLAPLAFPGSVELGRMASAVGLHDGGVSPWLPAHLVVALCAYGFLTIAALHALFMAALDRWLHRSGTRFVPEAGESRAAHAVMDARGEEPAGRSERVARAVLGPLPPLMAMERILFRLIGIGFALLTLTVVTGVVFSEALFGQPMKFDHKTVFTLCAWVIFAALLVGRIVRGWRGRIALSWTLSGFAMLFLAYAGSRFVLEVILHRV